MSKISKDQIKPNAVDGSTVVDGSLANADLAANAGVDATKLGDGSVDNNELKTLDGVSGAIQTQLDGKEPTFSKNTAFNKNFGTASGTVCEGNDSRLSDDRTASGIRTVSGIVVVSASAAPAANYILQATSATAASWVNRFMSYEYNLYTTPASRTSSTFASYVSYTTASLPTGASYTLCMDINYSIPNPGNVGSGEIEIDVRVDGTSVWSVRHGVGRNTVSTNLHVGCLAEFSTSSTQTHSIDVQWRSVDNTTSMTINGRRLLVQRVG